MITCNQENNVHTTLWADLSFRLTVAGFRRNTSFESGNFTMIALIVASYVTAVDTGDKNIRFHQENIKAVTMWNAS